jgi:multidrug efflux system membrane fusion protein
MLTTSMSPRCSPSAPRRPSTTPGAASMLSVLLLVSAVTGCSGDKVESTPAAPKRPAVPVGVAAVEQKAIPLQIQAIGTVEASAVVSIKAQVGGELLRVHIKEGQDVKKGDLLFSIDPRAYEAALAQAEANLARDRGQVQQARAVLERDRARIGQARAGLLRDQTQAKNATVQEKRYADLLERGLIAQEQYDGIRTNSESLAATVGADEADVRSAEDTVRADEAAIKSAEQAAVADEALVDNAKLQLSYTTIRSPVDGRTGSLMLHEGNVVRVGGTGDSTLLVINQVQPIYVSFTVPQQQLPAINRYMAEGKLQVDALPAGEAKPVRGVVTFTDNAVDPTTGTIRLKASFTNAEKKLWPGQFVNVALTLATEPDALVVPSQAVQTGQQGAYVFVVKPDATVENRPVVVARTQGSESIIGKGLEKGESVVVDGQTRLVGGAKIEVRAGGAAGSRGGATRGADAPRAP